MGREQLLAGDRGNRVVVIRAHAEQSQRCLARDSCRLDVKVKLRPTALRNPAVEESARLWSRAEMADAESTRGLTRDGDATRVTPETPDVLLHPFQCEN